MIWRTTRNTLTEFEQARMDAEHMVNMLRPVFADGLSTQLYATLVEKKTVHAVAAVAHAVPVPAHSPRLSSGASAGSLNLRAKNKGNSAMVIPVRRRLRTKTPIAQQRIPSMRAMRRRMRSKGPPPKHAHYQPAQLQAPGGGLVPQPSGGGGPPAGGGQGPGNSKHLFSPPLRQGFGGPPDGGGDGGDSGGDEGATPLGTDEDPPPPRRNKPNGDPDSSGDGDGYGFRCHRHVSMSISK